MERVTAKQFRDHLDVLVDRVVTNDAPLHVSRRSGGDFVVISHESFEAEQETLRILGDEALMAQVRGSLGTMRLQADRGTEVDEL